MNLFKWLNQLMTTTDVIEPSEPDYSGVLTDADREKIIRDNAILRGMVNDVKAQTEMMQEYTKLAKRHQSDAKPPHNRRKGDK